MKKLIQNLIPGQGNGLQEQSSLKKVVKSPVAIAANTKKDAPPKSDKDNEFRLVLSLPRNNATLSKERAMTEVAEFHHCMNSAEEYCLDFTVEAVGVSSHEEYFFFCFTGLVADAYVEREPTEVVTLLVLQLETFFDWSTDTPFYPIYFEVNGNSIVTPKEGAPGVPESLTKDNLAEFMSTVASWDWFAIADVLTTIASLGAGGGKTAFSVVQFLLTSELAKGTLDLALKGTGTLGGIALKVGLWGGKLVVTSAFKASTNLLMHGVQNATTSLIAAPGNLLKQISPQSKAKPKK